VIARQPIQDAADVAGQLAPYRQPCGNSKPKAHSRSDHRRRPD
jgi:hypothetical protein